MLHCTQRSTSQYDTLLALHAYTDYTPVYMYWYLLKCFSIGRSYRPGIIKTAPSVLKTFLWTITNCSLWGALISKTTWHWKWLVVNCWMWSFFWSSEMVLTLWCSQSEVRSTLFTGNTALNLANVRQIKLASSIFCLLLGVSSITIFLTYWPYMTSHIQLDGCRPEWLVSYQWTLINQTDTI